MVATHMLKVLLPVAAFASYAAAEQCAGGEWDVIVVGKLEDPQPKSDIKTDVLQVLVQQVLLQQTA